MWEISASVGFIKKKIVAVGLHHRQCEFLEMQQVNSKWRGAVWCFIVFPFGVVSIGVCFTVLQNPLYRCALHSLEAKSAVYTVRLLPVVSVGLVYSVYCPLFQTYWVSWCFVAFEHCHILCNHSARVHTTV
jgi:hypothetical protein